MPRSLSRGGLVAGGLFLAWAYGVAIQTPAAGAFHDDGIYIVTARAMAEGQGYRIVSLPESPPQTKYPILFPWLLSLVWRIAPSFPENLPWLRTVPVASAAVWLGLLWRLLWKCGAPRITATTVVALTAVSPWVLFLSTAILSETLFAALTTGTLLALTSVQEKTTDSVRRCAIGGLLAGASFLTRAAGVATLAAGLGWLLMKRRWTGALAFGAAAALLVLPWEAWALANAGAALDPYYSASNYGSWNVVSDYAWPEKLTVVAMNTLYSAFTPFSLWNIDITWWVAVPALVMAVCVCRGIWLTPMHPVTWYVVAYLVMVILWVWPPVRLLVPIVPLMLWHASLAIRRVPTAAIAVVVSSLLAVSSVGVFQVAAHARARGLMWPRAETAEDWRQLSVLFDWIRRETRPDAVLAGNLDPTYFLYTGRKAVRAFAVDPYLLYYPAPPSAQGPIGGVADFRRRLLQAGVDYCVWSPSSSFGEAPHFRRLLDDLSRDYPGSLSVAAGDVTTGYVVYRIDRTRL